MSQSGISTIQEGNLPDDVATSYVGDFGVATPAAHILNVLGGTGISVTGFGDTLTIDNTTISSFTLTSNAGVATSVASNINTLGSGSITTSGAGETLSIALSGLTNHSVLVGDGTSTIKKLGIGSNGQVLLGSTNNDPVFSTLTSTGGTITFTTGPGTLNLESLGGASFTWSVVTVNASFTVNTGTIANKAGLLTMTLPATAAIGDIIEITGINTALGWSIAQNANQQIFFGSSATTLGVGGSISSINIRDSVKMVCVVAGANTVWNVITAVGNLTIV